MTEFEAVSVDIGGTHARFAIARIRDNQVESLGDIQKLLTSAHESLEDAWAAYGRSLARDLPLYAAIAIAGPVDSPVISVTNNHWRIDKAGLATHLGLEHTYFLNDFGAVGYATAQGEQAGLRHVIGPQVPLPANGVVSIVGPGTGLGVAILLNGRHPQVIETEGGHVGFASTDPLQDAVLAWLHTRHKRVSVERIVSGPGLLAIACGLAAVEGQPVPTIDDRECWSAALAGSDALAVRALDIFCHCFGSVCGDFVLAHGASALVLAGGITERLGDRLRSSSFASGFTAKGRFQQRMAGIPVSRITHAEPGLLGAAAALAAQVAT